MNEKLLIIYASVAIWVAGFLMQFFAGRQSSEPIRANFKNIAAILMGAAFLFYGIATFTAIRSAHHVTTTGMLTNLTQSCGRHSHSDFMVSGAGTEQVKLNTRYCGNSLQNFQNVTVSYIADFGTVTDLQIIPNGWKLHESDGSTLAAIVGIVCGALMFYRTKPDRTNTIKTNQ